MGKKVRFVVLGGLIVLVGMAIIQIKGIGVPFIGKSTVWSIGIYSGDSPFHFSGDGIKNPVLTAIDVHDVPAKFVADPFIIRKNLKWYMFFEVLNTASGQGDIGLAVSDNGFNWRYQKIVLDESFHLSYPYVFKANDEYYMVPETKRADSIRLYRAQEFPSKWVLVGNIIQGKFVDPSIFRHQNKWWLFSASSNRKEGNSLHLFYADKLTGLWTEHPKSPLIKFNDDITRPAGRVTFFDGKIIRYTQDVYPIYGTKVRAFEITLLTVENYEEKEVKYNPILTGSWRGWNSIGMHHIDPHLIGGTKKWIAAVDGQRWEWRFGWKK